MLIHRDHNIQRSSKGFSLTQNVAENINDKKRDNWDRSCNQASTAKQTTGNHSTAVTDSRNAVVRFWPLVEVANDCLVVR